MLKGVRAFSPIEWMPYSIFVISCFAYQALLTFPLHRLGTLGDDIARSGGRERKGSEATTRGLRN